MMMRLVISGLAALIALSQTATAGVPSCSVVRFYVAKYSEAAAVTWARNHGASETEIETARRCLHSATVQTATARSRVLAPVPAQERANHEPAEHDPDQVALHVVSLEGPRADPERGKVDSEPDAHGAQERANHEPTEHDPDQVALHVLSLQGPRADPERGKVDSEPDAHGFIRPKEMTTSRSSYVGAMHRAHRARVA